MARICAFVFNPAIRDARVIKQANSLAAQGHEVTIIGLADANYPEERATLQSGVEILRVPVETGRIDKGTALLGGLSSLPRKMIKKNVHLLLLPFVFAYVAYFGLTGSLEERLEWLVNAIVYGMLIFGFFYLLANASRLVEAAFFVLRAVSRPLLGEDGSQGLYDAIKVRMRRIAPSMFEAEIERRSRARIEHMVKMAQALSPDVVHCHDAHTLPAGAAMKKATDCRAVYDAHEIYEEIAQGNAESARRYRKIHNDCLKYVDGFVTINDSIAGWYKENYPYIPEPTVIMNATIRTPSFKYDGRLHKAVGVSAKQRILLYQGGFASKRGLEYLVRAAAHLPNDWTLVMMGWGRLEPTLRAIGDGINASLADAREYPAVHFLPAVPQAELPYWSAGATVGVIPYENVGLNHWFCTPNKLWEYPNAGVPVLVSPFPELRKPVEAYGYGWLLPDDQDPRKLAEQLAGLSAQAIEEARNACAVFNAKENWAKYEARLLALYHELLDPMAVEAASASSAGPAPATMPRQANKKPALTSAPDSGKRAVN